jgi:hypothetical protein
MNRVQICLIMLLGLAIGALTMILLRPQPVKAQGRTVYVDYVDSSDGIIHPRGSQIVGFACRGGGGSHSCAVASQ